MVSNPSGSIVARTPGGTIPLRVLRVYHSGVVSGWRERERELRRLSVDVTLVCPRRWNEGGSVVELDAGADGWVVPSRTLGRHPYTFVYNPFPLARLLLRNRFDLIEVHEEPASLAALELRMLAWLRHRRRPMSFYGAQNLEKRYPIPFRWIERGSLRRAAAAFPCNAEAGAIFVRKGFRGIVRQLDLGVQVDRFHPGAQQTREPADPFVIAYSGRLEEHKGVQVVLRALALLDARFRLELAGRGPHESELRALSEQLGVTDRVRMRGYLQHDELADFYRNSHALAVPSQTRPNWVEQFGRVAVEAMASGLPVLVSNSGSLPDLVGDAGLVLDEANPSAWADALRALADDEERRQCLRTAGLARAQRFTWANVAAQHAHLYRDVVS